MERTLETPVKERIKRELNIRGVYFRMPPANGYGRSSDFDFVCCIEGRFLGIEAKRDANEPPTALQHDNAIAAMEAGGNVLLIHKDNIGLVARTIDAMRQRNMTVPSYWPARPVEIKDDLLPPLLRRKRRDNL